jgi:hypothetical protein
LYRPLFNLVTVDTRVCRRYLGRWRREVFPNLVREPNRDKFRGKMFFNILLLIYGAMAAYDAYLSQRRMKAYGVNVELNRFLVWLSTRLGPELGVALGVVLPAAGWAFILKYFGLTTLLAVIVGWKAKLFSIQIASLSFEKHALEIKRLLDAKNTGPAGATLPPDESTSKSGPATPEDK